MIKKECLKIIGIIILIILVGLRINPVTSEKLDSDGLMYSTLFGGSAIDIGTAITQDSKGNIIIAGITYSSDFPVTSGAYDETHNGGADVFVSKFSPDGKSLLFSTFIGGSADELHYYSIEYWESKIAITVDSSDNIIVHGPTQSSDFPVTPGAYDETYNGAYVPWAPTHPTHPGDMFVLKLAENGSTILFSTYLGGSDTEENAPNIALDEFDNIYLSGWTRSTDFPVTPDTALNITHNGKWDVFIAKLAANGSSLLYSTYFGGSLHERGTVIERDLDNNIYIGGETLSNDLPTTPNAFDPHGEGIDDPIGDGFIAKLSPNGSQLLYSTYVSGSDGEKIDDIVLDASNNVYLLIGMTYSSDFVVTSNAYDKTFNGITDGLVMKITPSGDIVYSTYIGGGGHDGLEKILLDGNNDIYLMGFSSSTNYPTTSNAYAATNGGCYDFIITKMASNGSCLLYSSYFGGSGYEPTMWKIRQDKQRWENIPDFLLVNENSTLIVGTTGSLDYPVTNDALNKTLNGGSDVCISQLVFTDLPTFQISSTPTTTTTEGILTTGSTTTTTTTLVDANFPNFIYLIMTLVMIITLRKKQNR